jgi:aminoglycoside phosphotransferase (APT) family kinase protein
MRHIAMQLNSENLTAWLASQGISCNQAVVRGDFEVTSIERRNRGFRINSRDGGVFVKQVRTPHRDLIDSSRREANWYRAIEASQNNDTTQEQPARTEPPGHLRALVPKFVAADSARLILAVELLRNAIDLKEFQRQQSNRYPELIATGLARALGELHRTRPSLAPAPLITSRPEIFSITRRRLSDLVPETAITQRLAAVIAAESDIPQRLDRLATEWQAQCVIHGDLRWENVLITNVTGTPQLYLIDWEHAQAGDPLWDVAGAIESYIRIGMLSQESLLPVVQQPETPPGVFSVGPATTAAAQFWHAYMSEWDISQELKNRAALRTIEYTACRMIQSAFEHGGVPATSPEWCLRLLQAGINTLRAPELMTNRLVHDQSLS